MPLQRILLRVMLWSLAFAAVTGVLAVLFAAGDLVWRVTGTGLVTALACGVMVPISGTVDRAKTRSSGLLGMGVIVAEYIMALSLIWEIPSKLLVPVEEEIAITMALLAGAAAVNMFLLQLTHEAYAETAARVGIAVTAAAFTLCMVPTWSGSLVARNDPWWETGWALFQAGGLATIGLVKPIADGGRRWRWLGVIAAAIAGALWVGDIWIGTGSDPGFVAFVVTLSTACVVAYANLAAFCPLTPAQLWVRAVSVVTAIVTAGLVDLIVIHEEAYRLAIDQDLLVRGASASGIVASCGALALCVLARLNRRVDFESEIAQVTEVVVICPRCRKKQAVPLGGSACRVCGLRIAIRVEEPRCPHCEYLLLGLIGDRCPECGRVIAEATKHA